MAFSLDSEKEAIENRSGRSGGVRASLSRVLRVRKAVADLNPAAAFS